MTVSAHDVAREIRRRLPGVGDVKLQKLLYYCQGHQLAVLGQPLFHERVSAFDLGPVVGELWYAERNHLPNPPPSQLDEAALNTIGYVLSRYGGLSGSELVTLTHGEAPWVQADAVRQREGSRSERISDDTLRAHFRSSRDEEEPQFDQEQIDAWVREVSAEPTPARTPIDDPSELARQVQALQARRDAS